MCLSKYNYFISWCASVFGDSKYLVRPLQYIDGSVQDCGNSSLTLSHWNNDTGIIGNIAIIVSDHVDDLVQNCGISIACTREILQSCTKPSI